MWLRRVSMLATVALWWPVMAAAAGPSVTARAAIIIDAATGAVLWEHNADASLPPASTTKVMTAIVALESGRLGEDLTVSSYAASTPPSKIGLRTGQRMEARDLLFAVLLNSANDAATVVAEGLGGSEARFASRMTARARGLGATGTRFYNAHGLTESGHVSTARDLARMFRHGLDVPGFRDILETRAIRVPVEGPGARTASLRSHNRLLSGYKYPVIGKTGYTLAARRCFVGAGSNGNTEVVIALLGASDLWGDARAMFGWAFGDPEPERPVVQQARRSTAPSRVAQRQPSSRQGRVTARSSRTTSRTTTAARTRSTRTASTRAKATSKTVTSSRSKSKSTPARTASTSRTTTTARSRTASTAPKPSRVRAEGDDGDERPTTSRKTSRSATAARTSERRSSSVSRGREGKRAPASKRVPSRRESE